MLQNELKLLKRKNQLRNKIGLNAIIRLLENIVKRGLENESNMKEERAVQRKRDLYNTKSFELV